MERGQGKDRSDKVSPALRKCINIQTIGMAFVLAIPVAMMLADMYGLRYLVPQIAVLLFAVGMIIFAIGTEQRRQVRARENTNE